MFRFLQLLILAVIVVASPPLYGANLLNSKYFKYIYSGQVEGANDFGVEKTDGSNGNICIIKDIDLTDLERPMLKLWGINGRMYLNPLTDVMISLDASGDEWFPVSINSDGSVFIPKESKRISCNGYIREGYFLTIGEMVAEKEDIVSDSFDMKVLKGENTDNGILAEGEDEKVVEIELSSPEMSLLTQGIVSFKFEYDDDYRWMGSDKNYPTLTIIGYDKNEEFILPFVNSETSWQWEKKHTQYITCLLPEHAEKVVARFTFSKNPGINLITIYNKGIGIYQYGNKGITRPNPNKTDFTEYPNLWYDIDGDGKMEWFSTGKLYKLTYDNYGQTVINQDFIKTVDNYYIRNSTWYNLGRGDNVDLLNPRLLGDQYSYVYKVDDGILSEWLKIKANLSRIDYNNDGQPDLWIKNSTSLRDQEVLTYGPEGEFRKEYINIMSRSEYLDYWVSNSGGLPSAFGYWSVPADPAGSFGDYRQIDLNNDGFLDFVDADSGVCLINLGNGYFVSENIGGSVLFRDFDGDGMCDQFVYNETDKSITIFLQRVGEEPQEVKLFSGLACGNEIWCRDFDKDGDIDILVPFNSSNNKGYAYLLMFENDGKGNFKKHEYFIEGSIGFRACADIDSDGEYEVIAEGSIEDGSKGLFSYNLNGIEIDTSPQCIDYKAGSFDLIGDPANTGSLFLIKQKGSTPAVYCFENINTPPERPAAPEVNYDPSTGAVNVRWGLGSDKETAPLDLTYELRIGTAPDKCDILWADALADGKRRKFGQGNTGYGRMRNFNANYWPEGKIYVSLQVVDDNGIGSPFSEYTVFDKKEAAVGFTISKPETAAVTDTITMTLLSPSTARYNWDCDGANIVAQDDKSVSLIWNTPGTKKVSVQAISQQGCESKFTREVEIYPARLEQSFKNSVAATLDMDGDGSTEVISGQFLEGDADGVYTPVKRLFNSNIDIISPTVADINKDGMPDVIHHGGILINEGDKSMMVSESRSQQLSVDFDNDGFIDASPLLRNSGDYINFVDISNPEFRYCENYYDYDNDGLVDLIVVDNEEFKIYRNLGNFQFTLLESFQKIDFGSNNSRLSIGDIDGDGKADMAWTNAGFGWGVSWSVTTAHIRWNDGEYTDIEAPAGYRFTYLSMFDFDNSGTQDLIIGLAASAGSPSAYVIVYMNPDRTWNMVKYTKERNEYMDIENRIYHRTDGKLGYCRHALIGPDNTPPTPPSNIRVERDQKFLTVEWDPSSDAENASTVLKYNISIKHKDREGEGSYFISPLNFGRNGVHIPSQATLINGTKFTIPIDLIPNGDYEIKVQAVDTQWQESEFSEVCEYKFVASPFVSIPEATMVGQEIMIQLRPGIKADEIDFGQDAEVKATTTTGVVAVCWSTEGDKILSYNDFEVHVFVHPALDATFELPELLYFGDRVLFACDNTHNSSWSWRDAGYNHDFYPLESMDIIEIDDSHIEFTVDFRYECKIEIRHTLVEDYGKAEHTCIVNILNHPVPLRIAKLLVDQEYNKHILHWEIPEHLVNLATGVNVYKEWPASGKVDLLASLPIDTRSFMDVDSDPDSIQELYYYINYTYPYGESQYSHYARPMYADVWLDENENWNLSWYPFYNGVEYECHKIFRGSTPSDMSPIDIIDADSYDYTDFNTLAQEYYYRIEVLEDVNNPESVCGMSNLVRTPEHPSEVKAIISNSDSLSIVYDGEESLYHISGIDLGYDNRSVIEIFDLNGLSLYSYVADSSSVTVDLSHLPKGVYILKVVGGSAMQTTRFLKHD